MQQLMTKLKRNKAAMIQQKGLLFQYKYKKDDTTDTDDTNIKIEGVKQPIKKTVLIQ